MAAWHGRTCKNGDSQGKLGDFAERKFTWQEQQHFLGVAFHGNSLFT